MNNVYKYSASDFISRSGWTKDQYSELFKERKTSPSRIRSVLRLEEIDHDFKINNLGRNKIFTKEQLFYMYLYKDFVKTGFSPNYFTPAISGLKGFWQNFQNELERYNLLNELASPSDPLRKSLISSEEEVKNWGKDKKDKLGEQVLFEIEEYRSFVNNTSWEKLSFDTGWALEILSNKYGDWLQYSANECCIAWIRGGKTVIKEITIVKQKVKMEGLKWGEEKLIGGSGMKKIIVPLHRLHTRSYIRLDLGEVLSEFRLKFKDI